MSVVGGGRAGTDERWRLWLRATRPASLLTSVLPGAAGGLTVVSHHGARPWLLAVALLALLCVHAATNAANDVEDAARGVDAPEKERNSGVFSTGRMSLAAGRRLYLGLAGGGVSLGILICAIQGPDLLVIGVLGVLGGLLYTAGPRPYKQAGLGEAAIVWLMGPLITQGAATAVDGAAFSARAFWLGAAPGLLIAAVLAANNLTDIPGDAAAGMRTLAVRLGFARARRLYAGLLLATPVAVLAVWVAGLFDAWILLGLLAVGAIVPCLRRARSATAAGDPRLEPLTPLTAQAHVALCALLILGVALGRP